MEGPEEQTPPVPSENDSTPTVSTSEVTSLQDPQIRRMDHFAETAGDHGLESASDQGFQTPVNEGTQAADAASLGNLPEGKGTQEQDMSQSQNEPPHKLGNQFILRLPLVRNPCVSDQISSVPDLRHAVVKVEDVSLDAKLVDLPCSIGSLKTIDRKTFYKMADISQMLVCSADGDLHPSLEEPMTPTDLKVIPKRERKSQKKYAWNHGNTYVTTICHMLHHVEFILVTPPLKNIRKKRLRQVSKKLDFKETEEISVTEEEGIPAKHRFFNDITGMPSCPTLAQNNECLEEVKKLLRSDAEAVSVRWEVTAEDETKEEENQVSTSGFAISPGKRRCKQGRVSSGTLIRTEEKLQRRHVLTLQLNRLCKLFGDSSSNGDEEDKDEDKDEDEDVYDEEEKDDSEDEDEEENDYEEDLERELPTQVTESGQYEAKEGADSTVLQLQQQIHYMERKLQEIQQKMQRKRDLLAKVENLLLKNYLHSVLEQLMLEEEKTEQLITLQKQLKCFLKRGETSD
ncbi:hypothetical protein MC885_013561 [Smutsia gigantea]|nr:hypothetical protein MC885_013561 [Smutsia gigantea]